MRRFPTWQGRRRNSAIHFTDCNPFELQSTVDRWIGTYADNHQITGVLLLVFLTTQITKPFSEIVDTFEGHNAGNEGEGSSSDHQIECPENFPGFHC
jgi:hypothetical protein